MSNTELRWECHLFGSDPELGNGIIYCPRPNQVPNRIQRWLMEVFFACLWIQVEV